MILSAIRIKEQAHALGFELAGIAPAADADGFAHLQNWLAQGFAGQMDYMTRHAEARGHPASILPSVRSVVMVGINYKQTAGGDIPPGPSPGGRGGNGGAFLATPVDSIITTFFAPN